MIRCCSTFSSEKFGIKIVSTTVQATRVHDEYDWAYIYWMQIRMDPIEFGPNQDYYSTCFIYRGGNGLGRAILIRFQLVLGWTWMK